MYVLGKATPCCRKYTQFCASGQTAHRVIGAESAPGVGQRMMDGVMVPDAMTTWLALGRKRIQIRDPARCKVSALPGNSLKIKPMLDCLEGNHRVDEIAVFRPTMSARAWTKLAELPEVTQRLQSLHNALKTL